MCALNKKGDKPLKKEKPMKKFCFLLIISIVFTAPCSATADRPDEEVVSTLNWLARETFNTRFIRAHADGASNFDEVLDILFEHFSPDKQDPVEGLDAFMHAWLEARKKDMSISASQRAAIPDLKTASIPAALQKKIFRHFFVQDQLEKAFQGQWDAWIGALGPQDNICQAFLATFPDALASSLEDFYWSVSVQTIRDCGNKEVLSFDVQDTSSETLHVPYPGAAACSLETTHEHTGSLPPSPFDALIPHILVSAFTHETLHGLETVRHLLFYDTRCYDLDSKVLERKKAYLEGLQNLNSLKSLFLARSPSISEADALALPLMDALLKALPYLGALETLQLPVLFKSEEEQARQILSTCTGLKQIIFVRQRGETFLTSGRVHDPEDLFGFVPQGVQIFLRTKKGHPDHHEVPWILEGELSRHDPVTKRNIPVSTPEKNPLTDLNYELMDELAPRKQEPPLL
ncbi:MAG: hypothetical protein C0514_07300 [Candidatus Puniceispirillum sp.]|nr:hypothetical protein [Candidatus Puniceispirillum sp.]